MKRVITGMAAALLVAVLVFPFKADAVSAKNAILLDAQTGRVLFEKNADQQALIASTTKIMTALLICEQCNVLDRMRIPAEAVGIEGSSMYLRKGEVLTIQDLLYGLMLRSGNDAAVALAIYCGGTVEGFVQMMNDKAHLLRLDETHFENPHGLDSAAHYSTAADMAKLAAYAMKNPVFCKTVSTRSITIGERVLRNHNKLLWRVEGVDGVKTGFTKAAGRILVSSATRQARRLIAVTMNDPNDWQDHEMMIEKGFSDFTVYQIVAKGELLGSVEVAGGQYASVALLADDGFSYPLLIDEQPQIIIQEPGFVYAPTVAGQSAGVAKVCIDGKVIGHVPLVYGDTVEQIEELKRPMWHRLFGG